MIRRPQRDAIGDRDLVDGLVGLAAIADQIRALVAELAADPETAEPLDDELVDAVLGLYALAAEVELSPPAEPDASEPARDDDDAKDLLR